MSESPFQLRSRLGSLAFARHQFANLQYIVSILAVKRNQKPAFMGDYQEFKEDYREAGRRLGLRVRITKKPPFDVYPVRKPNVPPNFLRAFHRMARKEEEVAWLFSKPEMFTRISDSISGSNNVGYVLGYPRCCVRQYELDHANIVEELFEYLANEHNTRDSTELSRIVSTDPPIPLLRTVQHNRVEETIRTFPYISHDACDRCLQGVNAESRKLNTKFEVLAREAGMGDEFAKQVSELSQAIKTRNVGEGGPSLADLTEF